MTVLEVWKAVFPESKIVSVRLAADGRTGKIRFMAHTQGDLQADEVRLGLPLVSDRDADQFTGIDSRFDYVLGNLKETQR